jgi:hypothetical protein
VLGDCQVSAAWVLRECLVTALVEWFDLAAGTAARDLLVMASAWFKKFIDLAYLRVRDDSCAL